MSAPPYDDPALRRFRSALADAYGDRIESVILFGSRARGDATPESDYDVAVFLRDMPDRLAEMDRLADIAAEILYAADSEAKFIHATPFAAVARAERTPLMHEIRAEGVEL
jgi:predicted nucleotidyltransferase